MPALRVTLDGTSTLLRPGRTYTVGRTPDADVTLTRPSCSRRHAEISFTDQGWQLTDVGSQHGTYVGGQKVQRTPLAERTTVWFSLPEDGTAVVFEPVADRPGGGGVTPEPSLQETVLPSSSTGADASLIVRWDGRDHFYSRGAVVRIGREDAADLVVSHPSVSRQHAVVFPDGDGWAFEDTSRSGSYVNGRQVQRLALTGPTAVRLGDPTTGAELQITPVLPPGATPPGTPARGAGWTLAAAAVALVVLAVMVVVGWQVSRDEEDPVATTPPVQTQEPQEPETPSTEGLSDEELTRAKLATVSLTARSTDGDGNPVAWGGSGSLLTPDGLILTNAHVAAPQSMGLAEIYGPDDTADPRFLLVSLTQDDDLPAAPAYRAEVVVSDGSLDIALIQIVSTANGGPLPDDLDLPTVPIGSSDELKTGDNLTVLGFPSISSSQALSVTRGIVATFIADPSLGSDRAEIDTDARIAPGNSGGMAINDDGELIGVPSAYYAEGGVPIVSGRVRPIDLVKPLIAEAEGN